MIAGGSEAAVYADGRRRLRRACARCRRATTSRSAPAGRSTRTATASSSARAPASSSSRSSSSRSARGAPIYAEMVGYGMSARRVPHDRAARGRRRRRPRDAGGARVGRRRARRQVDYINAHGTSTPHQRSDSRRWRSSACFGEHADKLAMSSTKSMTGHLLGAAGGLEAGITALAVQHQIVPPTINLDTPDPGLRSRLRAAHGARRCRSTTRCRTRSASAAPTARCCSRDTRSRSESELGSAAARA